MTLMADTIEKQETRLRTLLGRIIKNDQLHARWLNVLSYLEYIGSRKIFKTQKQNIINEAILRHASDEARHALALKQMVEKLLGQETISFEKQGLLCGYSAFRYFQSLDIMVKKELSGDQDDVDFSYRCYVYVSYIIEVRANWLYRIYSEELKQNNSSVSVGMIISDEIRHLDDMQEEIGRVDPNYERRIENFLAQEDSFFGRFLSNLEKNI